jgi:hypothetical protein
VARDLRSATGELLLVEPKGVGVSLEERGVGVQYPSQGLREVCRIDVQRLGVEQPSALQSVVRPRGRVRFEREPVVLDGRRDAVVGKRLARLAQAHIGDDARRIGGLVHDA